MDIPDDLAAALGEHPPAPGGHLTDRVRVLAEDLATTEDLIAKTEERLRDLNDRRNTLAHRELPDAMDEAGIDHVGLSDMGVDLVLRPFYKANIPRARQAEAFAWLEENGHGDLIKVTVSVDYERGELEDARLLVEELSHKGISAFLTQGVHWQTLTAFVREQVEAGEPLPLDLLGAMVGRVVRVQQRRG